MHDSKTHNLTTQYGYLIGVLGVSLILIWLGWGFTNLPPPKPN